jgi:hypothetical protein
MRYAVTDPRVAELVNLSAALVQDHLDAITACPVVAREFGPETEEVSHASEA